MYRFILVNHALFHVAVDRKAIIKHILDNLHVYSKFPRDPYNWQMPTTCRIPKLLT